MKKLGEVRGLSVGKAADTKYFALAACGLAQARYFFLR